jgi:hypothetical protein
MAPRAITHPGVPAGVAAAVDEGDEAAVAAHVPDGVRVPLGTPRRPAGQKPVGGSGGPGGRWMKTMSINARTRTRKCPT